MLVFIYDGSFEGLLTAIYDSYYDREAPDNISFHFDMQISIIDSYKSIETDYAKSEKVYNSINRKISPEVLEIVYNVFLSNDDNKEMIIFEYLKLGWKIGKDILSRLSDDRVLAVNKINYRVQNEAHKMNGFVRFKLVENDIYYAPIEPDNNIVEILAPHFADRFSEQNWIIHDVKRNIAAVYDKTRWVVVHDALDYIPDPDKKDLNYQKLWKGFFNSISIQSRTNPKLQKTLMPKRYWKNLTEKL